MSISSSKMTVKSHLPWGARLVIAIVCVVMIGVIAWLVYSQNGKIGGVPRSGDRDRELAVLAEQLKQLTDERDSYSGTVDAAESQLNIFRAAEKQMAGQVKTLETENAKLKEDLAFFESLLPNNIGVQGVTIQRLKAELTSPNQLHYRLLVMQGQNPNGVREFIGNLQLSVNVQQLGQTRMINFPDTGNSDAARFKLSFKYYQRLEGDLILPDGATIRSVQARVLEKGQVRAQQAANL